MQKHVGGILYRVCRNTLEEYCTMYAETCWRNTVPCMQKHVGGILYRVCRNMLEEYCTVYAETCWRNTVPCKWLFQFSIGGRDDVKSYLLNCSFLKCCCHGNYCIYALCNVWYRLATDGDLSV